MPNSKTFSREHFVVEGAEFLAAMANPNRLAILTLLQEQEHSVGSLCSAVGLSQSALSQHLAKLRAAKLVNTRRDAQIVYYRSASEAVRKVLVTLKEIVEG
jgi:DNA-binding transcriptional ArsR family regulator